MSAMTPLTGLAAQLSLAPAIVACRPILAGDKVWVVGGAVRDSVLGRVVTDIDLAVADGERELAAKLARAVGGAHFELSGEFATWRVVAPENEWHVDIARFRGGDGGGITADLVLRDLTVNAMALPLDDLDDPVMDPTGGLADLDAGRLRAASPTAFTDDPLRVLRVARLASSHHLKADEETRELARAAAPALDGVSGERIFAELQYLMAGSDPIGGLEAMATLGATEQILPELEALRGITQGPNHHLDVYDHTIDVLRNQIAIESELDRYAGARASEVADLLAEPLADGIDRRIALRFGALLHDVAKPATRTERDGRVGFAGHDIEGVKMIDAICKRLKTSRAFSGHLALLTREHLRLGFMAADRPLGRRQIHSYLRATEPAAVDVTLLTIADRLAARGTGPLATPAMIAAHMEVAAEIIGPALDWHRDGPPARLIPGDELAAELGIKPGPELGRILDEIEAAAYSGEVTDRATAIALARQNTPRC